MNTKRIAIYAVGGIAALTAVSAVASDGDTSPPTAAQETAATTAQETATPPPAATATTQPTPAPTATPEPTATPAPAPTDEEIALIAFRVTVGEQFPQVLTMSDQSIIDLAEASCEVARNADSLEQLALVGVLIAQEQGLDQDLVAAVTGASISGWCPEQGARLGIG